MDVGVGLIVAEAIFVYISCMLGVFARDESKRSAETYRSVIIDPRAMTFVYKEKSSRIKVLMVCFNLKYCNTNDIREDSDHRIRLGCSTPVYLHQPNVSESGGRLFACLSR